ncbi:hypothetical protein KR044_006214 [Drosophila immigrans]|nr:hypothetical protein KR044_006214 [Drosophila immigrans]
MKPIAEWLFNIAAGLLAWTQTLRMVKVANEDSEYYCPHRMHASSPAIYRESESEELPYIMGSEQISAALQHILSSDKNNFTIQPKTLNDAQKDCELGSESLNRLLEELMTGSSGNENSKLIQVDPAIRL